MGVWGRNKRLNTDLGGRTFEMYQANATKLMFDKIIVPLYATNCNLYILYVHDNAKNGC